MEEAPTNQKACADLASLCVRSLLTGLLPFTFSMEEAMLKALSSLFPSVGTTSDPAVEFYNKFQRAADDHDYGFIKKYDEDLNSTLIFVSVFPTHPNIDSMRTLCWE